MLPSSLEKYLSRARHLEVQILADHHGNLLHLYDAIALSNVVTKRSSKSLPPRNLPASIRGELCDAAVQLARKANYRNAGTVEFLLRR